MSEENQTQKPISAEDERLLRAIDGLGPDVDPGPELRSHIEALAALPYALPERPVRPEVRERLVRAVDPAADEADPPQRLVAASRMPASSPELAALERRTRWFLPIAAGLALALLGLAAVQFKQLTDQRRTIAALSERLEAVDRSGPELAQLRRQLAEKRTYLQMLTSRGTEFCVLKPVGDRPLLPAASATMVISPDREHWFLAAQGLEPCAARDCYQLWFLTDGETILAATFDAPGTAERIELGGLTAALPSLRGVAITRGAAVEPGDEPLLFADEAMTLL